MCFRPWDTEPAQAIRRLLADAGLRLRDVTHVALGAPHRRGDPLTQREMDIARSTQVRFEEAALHCLTRLQGLVPTTRLAMAGGCALNGVANARIQRETLFKVHYLQAAASDDGTCLGAAYWCWHNVLGRKERFQMRHAFWGPGYSDERVRAVAEGSGFKVRVCVDDAELVEMAAGLIAAGLVTGWYQGRSEWGPRALGNRSILANPASLAIVAVLIGASVIASLIATRNQPSH